MTAEFGPVFEKLTVFPTITLIAFGAVEPIIEVREEGVGLVLDVTGRGKFFVHDYGIGGAFDSIAPTEGKVVFVTDEDTVLNKGDGAREENVVEKDGTFVGLAVVVGVFEYDDATLRLVFVTAVEVVHVAEHFDDPDPAITIEFEGNWLFDERLERNGFDNEALGESESLEGFFDGEDRSRRNEVLRDHRIHIVVLVITVLGRQEGGCEEKSEKECFQYERDYAR